VAHTGILRRWLRRTTSGTRSWAPRTSATDSFAAGRRAACRRTVAGSACWPRHWRQCWCFRSWSLLAKLDLTPHHPLQRLQRAPCFQMICASLTGGGWVGGILSYTFSNFREWAQGAGRPVTDGDRTGRGRLGELPGRDEQISVASRG